MQRKFEIGPKNKHHLLIATEREVWVTMTKVCRTLI